MSVVINGSEKLYYVTNLQGDVTALLDEDGNEVAEYTYSAYGEINPQVYITGAEAFVGAMFNPLKYRGYVHDFETDWYYLQSRYYDPEIGRFLNADALVSSGQGFEGNNMFAYCGNSPIINKDPDGERIVGVTFQFEVQIGGVSTGVKVVIYFDKKVCGEADYLVAMYTYAGSEITIDDLSDVMSIADVFALSESIALSYYGHEARLRSSSLLRRWHRFSVVHFRKVETFRLRAR